MLTRRKTLIGSLMTALAASFGSLRAIAQEGMSLEGKTALVTGSTSGLGREVARRLGALGATVIVHGRDSERGEEVVESIRNDDGGDAVFYPADLASLDEVRELAERVRNEHDRLDLLINNAGIGGAGPGERRTSADGHELTFAVNYLSHFLLTRQLLPLIEDSSPARIINVASIGQAPLNFDDIMMTQGFNQMRAYSQSKLAQIMFTITLAERLDAGSVTVNSLHPATFMDTNMLRSVGRQPMTTVDEGADAVMQLVSSAALAGRTGLYFNGLEEARANAQAYDEEIRQELWDLSVELTEG